MATRSRVETRVKFVVPCLCFLNHFFFLLFQAPVLDLNNQLLAPGGKGSWGSWGKGSSGGTSAKPADSSRLPKKQLIFI